MHLSATNPFWESVLTTNLFWESVFENRIMRIRNASLGHHTIDLFRLLETIFMNMQIRRDVILDTLMAAVNVLRQWKMNQFQSWRANKRCRLCAI